MDVARALAYPYERPAFPYVHLAGRVLRLVQFEVEHLPEALVEWEGQPVPIARVPGVDDATLSSLRIDRRAVVLAVGSNAAPSQLARKLPAGSAGDPVVVLPAVLREHDVVYSAHFARYGSVPATLMACPGARADVHVTLLTHEQEHVMGGTEGGNYEYVRLAAPHVEIAGRPIDREVRAFVSVHGVLRLGGSPVGVSPGAGDSPHARLSQRALLERLASVLGSGSPEELVTRVVSDVQFRVRATRELRAHAGGSRIAHEGAVPEAAD